MSLRCIGIARTFTAGNTPSGIHLNEHNRNGEANRLARQQQSVTLDRRARRVNRSKHMLARVILGRALGCLSMTLGLLATPPATAAVEHLSASGQGAAARFDGRAQIDNRSVRTAVTVFAGALPASVGVTVIEIDEATGGVLFSGTGLTDAVWLQIGMPYDWAHLQAALQVPAATGDALRVVELNVVWHATAPEQAAPADGTTASVRKEQHEGKLRVADATGVVQLANPSVPGHVVTVTQANPPAVLWDTTSSGVLWTKGPGPREAQASGTAALQATTACTGGYWTGYWTWDGPAWRWYWTWVWYDCSGGWVVS